MKKWGWFLMVFLIGIAIGFGVSEYFFKTMEKEEVSSEENFNNIEDSVSIVSNSEEEQAITDADSPSDANELSAEDRKKWKGIYQFQCIEAQGEGPYYAKLKIDMSDLENDNVHVYRSYQEFDKPKEEGLSVFFGSMGWKDKEENKISFQYEVLQKGEFYNSDMQLDIFEKDGKYYIDTDLIVPEGAKFPLEIQKVQ